MKKERKGFTLIETLIAVAILAVALASFISIVLLGRQSFQTAKERYLAVKMAQEGMELAINKRDNHVICMRSGPCPLSDWKQNLIGSGGGVGRWEVDATNVEDLRAEPGHRFRPFNPGNYICFKTQPQEHQGKFGYCTGQETPIPGNYTREVNISSAAPNRILVKSIVTWQGRSFSRTITLEEVLFGLP